MKPAAWTLKKPIIAFVFDRVMHYQLNPIRQLDARLRRHGLELHMISGIRPAGESGRVAVAEQVIPLERKFALRDWKFGSFVFRLALGYLKPVQELRPAVVVCPAHPGDLGHWGLIALKRLAGYRLVAWQCGYEYNPGRLKRLLLKWFVPSFDLHLAYHGNARRYALGHGARPEQVVVMHNTLDETRFVLTDKRAACARLARLHPEIRGRRIVLYVGAVLEEKKLERLLDAMARLDREDAMLMIVGDGPHLPSLRARAKGRTDIVFAGQVIDGVGIYFDAAEVYVLPGTGGLGINEAMAHSLPIISGYADGSADDLVIDGENGYRLRENTVEELVDRIGKILDEPETAAKMGRTSRAWITGKFSFQRFLDRVESALVAQLAPTENRK